MRKTPQSFEAFAAQFMSLRNPNIGRATILEWSRALPRGGSVLDLGRFMFTASDVADTWHDVLTGAESISLGAEVYRGWLRDAGLLALSDKVTDEGENDYYLAVKPM